MFEILKRPLSFPDNDQVTVSFALYVDTAVWFSKTDTVWLPVITGLSSSTSVTVIVIERSPILPELSVAVTVKLYSLFTPSSPGAS